MCRVLCVDKINYIDVILLSFIVTHLGTGLHFNLDVKTMLTPSWVIKFAPCYFHLKSLKYPQDKLLQLSAPELYILS